MSTAFTWLLADTHHTFRVVLVDNVAVSVIVPWGEPPRVHATKAAGHKGAQAVALNWTKNREKAGYRLTEGVHAVEFTVDAEALWWEGHVHTNIGPDLNRVLEALTHGKALP